MEFAIVITKREPGGFLAVINGLPGCRAESPYKNQVVRMVMSIALNIIAERILRHEAHPEDLPISFQIVDESG